MDELVYLKNNILTTAQFYGERLIAYLRVNNATYPEYFENAQGDVQPAKGAYSSSIFIPGANRGNRFNSDGCTGLGYGFGINVNL